MSVLLLRSFDVSSAFFFFIYTDSVLQPATNKIIIHDFGLHVFHAHGLGCMFLLHILIGLFCYWFDRADSFSRLLATVKTDPLEPTLLVGFVLYCFAERRFYFVFLLQKLLRCFPRTLSVFRIGKKLLINLTYFKS